MSERTEALMRIVVGIVFGIILGLWKIVIQVVAVLHWFYVIFTGKRSRDLAEFCNLWNTQAYRFIRYMTFSANTRPFPFSDLGAVMHPVEISQIAAKPSRKK